MLRSSIVDLFDLIFKAVAVVAAIAGGSWAIYEYRSAQRSEAIDRTLSYVTTLHSHETTQAERHILDAWQKAASASMALWDRIVSAQTDSERNIAVSSWNFFVVNLIRKLGGIERDVQFMVDRLNHTAICINNGLCDRKTADIYLLEPTVKFLQFHCPYIIYVRKTQAMAYAKEIEIFAGMECEAQFFGPRVVTRQKSTSWWFGGPYGVMF